MRSALALLAALALAGCQLAPPHQRPETPTAARYPYPAEGEVDPLELHWRAFFADPQLIALIDAALTHNRDLRVASLRIAEARGLAVARRADRLPTLGLSAEASRGRAASGGPSAASSAGGTTPSAGVSERYAVGLAATAFELDFWGRVRHLADAAREQYLQTVEAEQAFRLSLINEVAQTYLGLRALDERLALARATVQSRQQALEIAQVRLDAGITSALDYRQSEALLTQAAIELSALALARAQQHNYLTLLTGHAPTEPLPAPRPLAEQIAAGRLAAGLPAELLLSRPDIRAAEAGLRAARADIGVARAAFFPRIALTGSFGYASDELGGLLASGNRFWSIGPGLALPLFDWGRNRGNLSIAQAREHIAVASYERAIETAFREVADTLAGRRFLDEQLTRQQANVATLQAIATLARDRYDEGAVGYLEVLDAERQLFAAQQALIETQAAQAQNLVRLYLALGGGQLTATADRGRE